MSATKRGLIPIPAAKKLAESYLCPMVVIFAIHPGGEEFTVTTYGKTKALCRLAADYGDKIAEAILSSKIAPAEEEPEDLPDQPMIWESKTEVEKL